MQSNFITEELGTRLNRPKKQANMAVTGINQSQAHSCHTVNVQIRSMHTVFSQNIECYVLNTITENLPQTYININKFKISSNIRLADPKFHIPSKVDLLIGAQLFW